MSAGVLQWFQLVGGPLDGGSITVLAGEPPAEYVAPWPREPWALEYVYVHSSISEGYVYILRALLESHRQRGRAD